MAKSTGTEAHRARILKVALTLLTKEGRYAVTTRKVAEAAQVQPPVLYRLFGDKNGLLDAVAAYGFSAYIARKQPIGSKDDVVEALRDGWDIHVKFGLANPELYLLMYADPRPGSEKPAVEEALSMLDRQMQRIAASGQLRVSVARASALYHAAAVGIVMLLLSTVPEQRDLEVSTVARELTLSEITTGTPSASDSTVSVLANQMCALLAGDSEKGIFLSHAERLLLVEWLQRLVRSHA